MPSASGGAFQTALEQFAREGVFQIGVAETLPQARHFGFRQVVDRCGSGVSLYIVADDLDVSDAPSGERAQVLNFQRRSRRDQNFTVAIDNIAAEKHSNFEIRSVHPHAEIPLGLATHPGEKGGLGD